MSTRLRAPSQAAIARALRAAQDAGLEIARFEVDGAAVRVYARGADEAEALDPAEKWLRAHGAR